MKTQYATEGVAMGSLEGRWQEWGRGGHGGEEAGPQVEHWGILAFFFFLLFLNPVLALVEPEVLGCILCHFLGSFHL